MKAWRIHEHGGPEILRLEDIPLPEPGPGEVQLRVRAVALNHLDLWVRGGVPGHTFPLPMTPGSDVAGQLHELGVGVSGWKVGDRVVVSPGLGCGRCEECLSGRDNLCRVYGILGETRDGGCAEFLVVPASHLMAHPDDLSPEESAALPLVLLTAWHMLVGRAKVRPGQWVLAQAGASGVSSLAIQVAKLWGARVIATVATTSKADRVREIGADHVLSASDPNLRKEIRRITGAEGVDIAIDHVGEATFVTSMACLKRGGCILNCGATTGPKVEIDLRHVFFKNLSILGSTMGTRGDMEESMRLVRQGRIKPVVDRVFPLEDLPEAHRYLEEGRAVGKVVLRGFQS